MRRKFIILVQILTCLCLLLAFTTCYGQNLTLRETVIYINNLLEKNPRYDSYLKSFTMCAIELSNSNELIIYKKTRNIVYTYKVDIADLRYKYDENNCVRVREFIGWSCKSDNILNMPKCVNVTSRPKYGEVETSYSSNLNVEFSDQNKICDKLNNAFDHLFINALSRKSVKNDNDPFSKNNYNKSDKKYLEIGDRVISTPSNYKLLGIESKDNSRIYRLNSKFHSNVFTYSVENYEIKVHNGIVVSMHFVLLPTDNTEMVPYELIQKVKTKSGVDPVLKGMKYYFDDGKVKTIIYRKNEQLYGGDRIFVMVVSNEYLNK